MKKYQSLDLQFQEKQQPEKSQKGQMKIEQQESQERANNNNKQLQIQNNHSLNLFQRQSIQIGMPIPKSMLSSSIDVIKPYSEDVQKDQSYPSEIRQEVDEVEKNFWVSALNLNELVMMSKPPKIVGSTKNVLRNIGNAQNQYIFYHRDAKAIVQRKLNNPSKFYAWVRTLNLQKFQHYQSAWGEKSNNAYRKVYKSLCYKFYKENAIPYILSSKMKDNETKISHIHSLYRFIEGLKNPLTFSYFKKHTYEK